MSRVHAGEDEQRNLQTIRDYLTALEAGVAGEALRHFFTPDVRQIEWPNKLNPNGGESDLSTLLARTESKLVIREQRYEIRGALIDGDTAAIEADWCGVLAIPLGTLAAGATMKAKFAMFFEFADGRIRVQRNYDCFEPW